MGDPRRQKKQYRKPKRIWETSRIERDKKLINKYGLKNKKEIWKVESSVGKIRAQAKKLITASPEEQEILFNKLANQGLIKDKRIESVLELKPEDFFDRRLQTVTARKFSLQPKHARQIISHGKLKISGRRVTIPSFFVDLNTEKEITLTSKNKIK